MALNTKADLSPPLGNPGGPCHVIRRIREEITDQREEDGLVHQVELNKDLSNPEAAQVYDLDAEQGVGIFKQIVIGPHAQYRMDLRSITVDQVRSAMSAFLKQLNDWKSQKSFEYQDHVTMLSRGEPIEWFDRKTGLMIIFKGEGAWQIKLVTIYPKGKPDPKTRPGQCVKAGYQSPAGDLSGYNTFVKNPNPDTDPDIPAGLPDGSDEREADAEKQQVLPSPETRSKPSGKPSFNGPPASGEAPDGKSLSIDKARTLGVPGGGTDDHPWVDNSTGYHQIRPDISAAFKGPAFPGTHRQKEQEGVARKYYQKYYRKNQNKIKTKTEKWNRQHENNTGYQKDKQRREEYPGRYKRKNDGVRDPAERSKEWRAEQSEAKTASNVSTRWVFGDFLYEKRPPEMDPEQRFDRGTGPPRTKRDRRPGPDFGEVNDNPGSAKVIPDGHGFVNNTDRTFKDAGNRRTAVLISELLSSTFSKVHDRSKVVGIKLKRVDQKNRMWMFAVPGTKGVYKVRVKALPMKGNTQDLAKADVQVSCNCPFFRWQGPEYHAKQNGYMYGQPIGTASTPDIMDPERHHWVCKHVIAVLQRVLTFAAPSGAKAKLASFRYLADTLDHGMVTPVYGMSVRVATRYLEGKRL